MASWHSISPIIGDLIRIAFIYFRVSIALGFYLTLKISPPSHSLLVLYFSIPPPNSFPISPSLFTKFILSLPPREIHEPSLVFSLSGSFKYVCVWGGGVSHVAQAGFKFIILFTPQPKCFQEHVTRAGCSGL